MDNEQKTYTRDEAIKWLIANNVDRLQQDITNENDYSFFESILMNGFDGYDNVPTIELQDEMRRQTEDNEIIVIENSQK